MLLFVTTKSYYGYYWTLKMTKNGQNLTRPPLELARSWPVQWAISSSKVLTGWQWLNLRNHWSLLIGRSLFLWRGWTRPTDPGEASGCSQSPSSLINWLIHPLPHTLYPASPVHRLWLGRLHNKQACFTGYTTTLPDATPLSGKIHLFSRITTTFEVMMIILYNV